MKYETNLNGNKPKTIKSLILDEKGNPLPLREEPKRDWLTGWVSKKFPKVMEASDAIGRLPNTLNPVKTLQTLLDFTGVPGVINNIAGNPMNLPAHEVEASMIPGVSTANNGFRTITKVIRKNPQTITAEQLNSSPVWDPSIYTYVPDNLKKLSSRLTPSNPEVKVVSNVAVSGEHPFVDLSNLEEVLGKMKINNNGSFIRRSLQDNNYFFLDKKFDEHLEEVPYITDEVSKKYKEIIPMYQSLQYSRVSPTNGIQQGNLQIQKYAPGKFIYNNDYSQLTQEAIDQAKEALFEGAKSGLKFDFRGANNVLYDAASNKFSFIDIGHKGTPKNYYSSNPLKDFTRNLEYWISQGGYDIYNLAKQRGIKKWKQGGKLVPKDQTGNSILNNYEPLKKKLLLDSLNKSEKVPEDLTAKSSSTYVSPSIPKYYSENIDPGYIRQSPSRGKQILNNALYYTDNIANVAQLGNFIPNPIAQTVGRIGSGVSTGIDLVQAGMSLNNGDYKSAALNAGWAILSNRLGANSFKRNSKYLKPGQPMYYASPQFFGQLNSNGLPLRTRYIEVFNKTRHMKPGDLSINRALLGGLGAESLYDYDK